MECHKIVNVLVKRVDSFKNLTINILCTLEDTRVLYRMVLVCITMVTCSYFVGVHVDAVLGGVVGNVVSLFPVAFITRHDKRRGKNATLLLENGAE